MARIVHQSSAAAGDVQHSVAPSRLGVLDVLLGFPRPNLHRRAAPFAPLLLPPRRGRAPRPSARTPAGWQVGGRGGGGGSGKGEWGNTSTARNTLLASLRTR
jgi:hypothetical protein